MQRSERIPECLILIIDVYMDNGDVTVLVRWSWQAEVGRGEIDLPCRPTANFGDPVEEFGCFGVVVGKP